MNGKPVIIYVPGLLPKPAASVHRAALLRCLQAGLERRDPALAALLGDDPTCFEIVAWTYDFYGEHRDFALDAAAVDALIAQGEVAPVDIAEAHSWPRRIARWAFTVVDHLPFLIPHVATERMRLHLRDLRRYTRNRNECAEHTRNILKDQLRAARAAGRPILLLAHSMGSVIAYEALWQMARANREPMRVELLLTMGSPLGQRYIRRRIKGNDAIGAVRYPNNIHCWENLSAAGDLTSIDPTLAQDFGPMLQYGLVKAINDQRIRNWFRLDGVLNPHSEYGYLINPETAAVVSDWWQALSSDSVPAE